MKLGLRAVVIFQIEKRQQMKNSILILLSIVLVSCSTSLSNKTETPPLFEVLTQQPDGGGNLNFYEIISDEKEFKVLQNDSKLKRKIKPSDILSSNFLILNLGEKTEKGFTIQVTEVKETSDNIILKVVENNPSTTNNSASRVMYPYSIIKINSKKEIIIK